MLDKAHLRGSTPISSEKLHAEFGSHLMTAKRHNAYYSRVQYLRPYPDRECTITIYSEPQQSSMQPQLITLNPNRFKSYSEMNNMILRITDPNNLEFTRLDIKQDCHEDLETIRNSLKFGLKRQRNEFPNSWQINGFYIGSRSSDEYWRVYRKKSLGDVTRIEVVKQGEKLPVKYYMEFEALRSWSPFAELKLIKINEDAIQTENDRIKVGNLKNAFIRYGAHGGCKSLNKNGNFKRDYGHLIYMVPVPFSFHGDHLLETEKWFATTRG
jgi:hypothetical protein